MNDDASSEEPEDWTEVDILPSDPAQRDALLLDVIDPLINQTLSERIESWHFFWEVDPIQMLHLRLSIPPATFTPRSLTSPVNEQPASSRWPRTLRFAASRPGSTLP